MFSLPTCLLLSPLEDSILGHFLKGGCCPLETAFLVYKTDSPFQMFRNHLPHAGLTIHFWPSPASFNFFSLPFKGWSLRQCVSWRWIWYDHNFIATLKSNCLPFLLVIVLCSHFLNSFMFHPMVADQRLMGLETFYSSFGMLVLPATFWWCAMLLLLPSILYYLNNVSTYKKFQCSLTLLSSQSGRFLRYLILFYCVLQRSFTYCSFYQQVFCYCNFPRDV